MDLQVSSHAQSNLGTPAAAHQVRKDYALQDLEMSELRQQFLISEATAEEIEHGHIHQAGGCGHDHDHDDEGCCGGGSCGSH